MFYVRVLNDLKQILVHFKSQTCDSASFYRGHVGVTSLPEPGGTLVVYGGVNMT